MNRTSTFTAMVFLLLIFIQAPAAWAQTGNRYALVIGNAAYQRVGDLPNTINDARDISAALERLGFNVALRTNLSHHQMVDEIDAFTSRLARDASNEGFFWYAGHAVEIQSVSYMLPVDVRVDSQNQVISSSYSLNALVDTLHDARNRINIMVLDACRDNPLPPAREGGRTRSIGAARGINLSISSDITDLFVVFSTSPGNVAADGDPGGNSPFAQAFLEHIASPEPFLQMNSNVIRRTNDLTGGRQRPFNQGSLSDGYFSLNRNFQGTVVSTTVFDTFETGEINVAMGSLEIHSMTAGTMEIQGGRIRESVWLPDWGILPIPRINAGRYRIVMRYEDGYIEEKNIEVPRDRSIEVEFNYRPAPPVQPSVPDTRPRASNNILGIDRLWTLGASIGTSFAAPLLIGTIRTTLAPLPFSFLELGFDIGLLSGHEDSDVSYYSMYPFAHYAFYIPLDAINGFYIGAGGGYMMARYTFPEGELPVNIFALSIITGFNIGNAFDLSLGFRFGKEAETLDPDRENSGFNVKLSLGYTYRF